MLLIGQLLKHISDLTRIPYTAMIAAAGGGLFLSPFHQLPAMGIFESLDTNILMMLLIPPLIFDAAFNSDWYTFRKQFGKIMLLAFPVLAICVGLTAVMMFYGLQYGIAGDGAGIGALTWA